MSIENLLEITARLSDVQELLTRGRTTEAAELIEDTKKELFFREHDDTGGGLSFRQWCMAKGIFATFSKPGDEEPGTAKNPG